MENSVSYAVYEGAQVRHERTVKRLIISLVIAILLIFASNAIWLYAWCQYDYTGEQTQTITIDGKDGTANYIGNDGDINNGEDYSDNQENEDTP